MMIEDKSLRVGAAHSPSGGVTFAAPAHPVGAATFDGRTERGAGASDGGNTEDFLVGAHRLRVTRLTLTRFRGYRQTRIETDARSVVLSGPNGAGKTNLLEAVSFLVPGRGLRQARLSDVVLAAPGANGRDEATQNGTSTWAVAARLDTPTGRVDLGTGFDGDGQGVERRVVRIDGEGVRSQAALSEHFSALWLTPQMDRLFIDGADARRRFLDRLVFGFDPAHVGRTNAYRHAVRERAKLLKDGVGDAHWLNALEETIARRAVAIAAARQEMAHRLDQQCRRGRPPFPVARVDLNGSVERWLEDKPALTVEDHLRRILRDSRPFDARHGGAGGGRKDIVLPHRADLVVHHAVKGHRADMCSTGEQKMLLTGLILAGARMLAAERGVAPVLLLDEVAAHLDENHRVALFAAVAEAGGQAWFTGTDPTLFAPLGEDAHFYRVENAQLTKMN
ncbi:DNA replication/repair protein RecF [Varunaivibrio sulfuroxidans]|uniref:DNA replication and repair protein RecF n=1 Tax=Varunaivibrio sulfuroxidans TaxID=1773489 RepID=A0A4R3JHX9_9PROT|nr:DNA replication/repair protein RecF [Varunaivibrio sulfuroxidans]TCS65125.1 DNA replication and repair protein RecF [Varunaivibrio sulfuroxidans]WES29589.1 DNA replication/repair protein RecF [Varunaivibrio sulfuroxidans]